jgi:hypothetical protein
MYKLFCIFLLFIQTNVFSQTNIGVVVIVDGLVWKIPSADPEQKIEIKINDNIIEGDQIITSSESFVKFLMVDDTVIDLGEETKFSFAEFKLGETKDDRKAKYDFSFGKIRSIFSIKAKKEGDIEIKTPDVVMGVRGTEILADVYRSNQKFKTEITLLHGKLNIKDLKRSKNIDINPGDLFKSDVFNFKKDMQESIKKLNPSQIKQLTLGNIMNKGIFLYDVIHKQKMPMHQEVKSMMKEIKKDQPDNETQRDQKKFENQQPEQLKKNDDRSTHSPIQRKALTDEMRQKIQNQLDKKFNQPSPTKYPPPPGSSSGSNTPPPTNNESPTFNAPPPGTN